MQQNDCRQTTIYVTNLKVTSMALNKSTGTCMLSFHIHITVER